MNILITDANMRSSLAVIRSLGEKKHHIVAADECYTSMGYFSKYTKKIYKYPSPSINEPKFIDNFIRHIKNNKYDLIIPVADACLNSLSRNKKEIEKYSILALPEYNIFKKAYDKSNTIKIAQLLKISCPKTYFPKSIGDIKKLRISYPIIIKPCISSGSRGFHKCMNYDELKHYFTTLINEYSKLMVQEYIPNGGEFGIYALCDKNSEIIAMTAQRRIRSFPISGGPSTYRETFANTYAQQAFDISKRILKAIKWTGVAMVEFKINKNDNRLIFMEINPRFWGSLQLSINSGVDFPLLLSEMYTGKKISPVLSYGITQCRWLLPGDLLWYIYSPNKINNFIPFIKSCNKYDILTKSDIGPIIGFGLNCIVNLFNFKKWQFLLRR